MRPCSGLVLAAVASAAASASRHATDACPGYRASNVTETGSRLTAELTLAGEACNAYGTDLKHLTLEVTYETGADAFHALLLRHSFDSSCPSEQLANQVLTLPTILQTTASTSRFRTATTKSTRCPSPSSLGPAAAVPRRPAS